MFTWMYWTTPITVFFTVIVLIIAAMTIWELKSPTVMRKGFLPIATTRGDRLFIGLLSAAYINLMFLGFGESIMTKLSLDQEPSIWISFVASVLFLGFVMRKG
jgi:predicted small integral membrane protein